MTVAQLERAVANLGFAPSIEDGGELLLEVAGRALGEISAVRPRLASGTLWHLPAVPCYLTGSLEPVSGQHSYALPGGRSYFLRIFGSGRILLRSTQEERIHHFNTAPGGAPAVVFGTLGANDRLHECIITGDGTYRLLSLAVYEELINEKTADPEQPAEYDLSEFFEGFAEIVAPPMRADGRALCEGEGGEYTCRDGRYLRLRLSQPEEVHLTYRKSLLLPKDGHMPLSDEEAALMPLYCAAYLFLDEEPERSSFYLARFREGLSALAPREERVAAFCDVTGWG